MNADDQLRAQMYQMMADSSPSLFGHNPPPQPPPFPFMGAFGPQGGALLQMAMPGLSEMLRGPFGGFAFNWGGTHNVFQAFEARRYAEETMRVRREAAQADVPLVQQTLRGAYRWAAPGAFVRGPGGNLVLPPHLDDAINRLGGNVAQMLPFISAVAPDAVDAFGGQIGLRSAAADLFQDAGRFLVGRGGRVGNFNNAEILDRTFKQLFQGEGTHQTSGLGSRRVGELYKELVGQGIVGGGEDTGKVVEDASKQLKEYSKAVSAVRDLFAANGRTNAPMAELLASLKAITQMSVGTVSGDELARVARQVQGAARFSPLGLTGMIAVGGMAAAAGQAYGVRSAALAEVPLDVAAATNAFAGLGYGKAVGPGGETLNRDEHARFEVARRARALASPLANLAGAVLAQAEHAGADTPLGRLAARVRAGDMPAELLRPDAAAYVSGLAAKSGLTAGSFTTQLYQAAQDNQAALARHKGALQGVAGAGQRQDFEMMLRARAGGLGVDADKLLAAVYAEAGRATGDQDLASRVAKALGKDGAFGANLGAVLGSISTLNANAAGLTGDAARAVSVTNTARAVNPEAERMARNQRALFETYGKINAATTAVGGRGGIVGRVVGSLFEAGAGQLYNGGIGGWEGAAQLGLKALGMVSNTDVEKQLGGLMKDVTGLFGGTGKAVQDGQKAAGGPPAGETPNKPMYVRIVDGKNTREQMDAIGRGFRDLRGAGQPQAAAAPGGAVVRPDPNNPFRRIEG